MCSMTLFELFQLFYSKYLAKSGCPLQGMAESVLNKIELFKWNIIKFNSSIIPKQ